MRDLIIKFNDDQYQPSHDCSDNTSFYHRITRKDAALLIGVSSIENFKKDYVSGATENDVHSMQDILVDLFGLRPGSIQALSHLSRHKATTRNVKKYLSSISKSMKRDSTFFIYISGPCWIKNEDCFVPTQDYNKKGAKDFAIFMSSFVKPIRESKARFIVMILDCDNAEEFVRPLVESCKSLNKHLYVICSSQNFGRSLADEKILKHGYLTFFLKFYLKRLRSSTVSLRAIIEFLKQYITPLSRIAYHPVFKQSDQIPLLLHRAEKADEIETDGVPTSISRLLPNWKQFLHDTITNKQWLKARSCDGEVLLGDRTFTQTQLLVHTYLTCLKSFSLLLFEYDKLHMAELDERAVEGLVEAIVGVVRGWVGRVAHPEHDKWSDYEELDGVDKGYVLQSLKQGSSMVMKELRERTESIELDGATVKSIFSNSTSED